MNAMRIVDAARARSAFNLLFIAAAVNAGGYLANVALSRMVPMLFGTATEYAFHVFWLGVSVLWAVALTQVALSVAEPMVPWLAVGLVGVNAALDLLLTLLSATESLSSLGGWNLVNALSILLSLAERAVVLWIFVSVAMARFAWTVPVAGTVLLASVARHALTFAMTLRLIDVSSLYASGWYAIVTLCIGLLNTSLTLLLAWTARNAVNDTTGGVTPVMPPTEHGLHAPPMEETPASPAADFAIGGVILAIGIAVTLISASTASNGGRYIVAIGAIAVGIGRIIRGFIRLARR
ncbi:MAG: hypothetical protein ACO1OB_29545 [Archangium sp.]